MSVEVPGLSHPSVLKALASGEPLSLRLSRQWSPRGAGSGRAAGRSVPLHPCTSLSLCPGGGYGCASCPLAQGLQAGQPPRPSRQAPGSTSVTPPCRRSAPDAHLECPGEETRRSSQVSAAHDP